jgi:hypothetical protein
MVVCLILYCLFFCQSGIKIQGGFFCPSWKILGDWSRERDSLSALGVSESELPSMQEVALMGSATSIDRISGDGLAQMFQMDSDLVGASCARTAFDKGLAFFRGEDAVVCERIATPFIDGHFLAVGLVSTDSCIDLAVWHSRCAIYKC